MIRTNIALYELALFASCKVIGYHHVPVSDRAENPDLHASLSDNLPRNITNSKFPYSGLIKVSNSTKYFPMSVDTGLDKH